jgi:hypothetical protein
MYAEVDSRTRAAVWLRAALAIDYKCVDALQVSAAYVTSVYITPVCITVLYDCKQLPSVRSSQLEEFRCICVCKNVCMQ